MCWTQERRQEREVVSPNFVTFVAAISDCVEQQKPGRHENNSCRFLRTSHSRTSLDRYSNFFARISISTTGLPGSEYSLPIFQHHSISAGTSLNQCREFFPSTQRLVSAAPSPQVPVPNQYSTIIGRSSHSPVFNKESCQAITHNQPRICPAVEAAPLKRVLA